MSALRHAYPVLAHAAYLNAGTNGPLSAAAATAARAELDREEESGRTSEHFARNSELRERLREAFAAVLGCPPADLALTTSTSDGLATVLAGLPLDPGDEILTSDEEHPGLLGALQAARDLHGATIRMAPFADLADAVGSRTRAVACSHVGWRTGRVAPAALAELDIPVILDGAQAAGAIPVDVAALGCAAYAAAGQKWLCGPDGTGMLYVAPALRDELRVTRRGYTNFTEANAGLAAKLHETAQRFDAFVLSAEALACALAAVGTLAEHGWAQVHHAGTRGATSLAERLADAGLLVASRDETTLVSWENADPAGTRERLFAEGIVIRDLPGTPLLRASVGAWNDEHDIDRLLMALAA